MVLVAEHPFLVAALVALVAVLVGWRLARAAIRRLRVFVRAFWPH